MSRHLRRLIRSQILFREVNERVRETVDPTLEALEFLCECSNEDCTETVYLEVKAYEEIRAHPNLFLVAAGHENLEVDRVVDQGPGCVLVEKTVGANIVEAADPRSRER
jgi:hypothetical protein